MLLNRDRTVVTAVCKHMRDCRFIKPHYGSFKYSCHIKLNHSVGLQHPILLFLNLGLGGFPLLAQMKLQRQVCNDAPQGVREVKYKLPPEESRQSFGSCKKSDQPINVLSQSNWHHIAGFLHVELQVLQDLSVCSTINHFLFSSIYVVLFCLCS